MKKLLILGMILGLLTTSGFAKSKTDSKKLPGIALQNKLFTIYIPEELKGSYYAEIKNDRISIYDKASKKAGYGGFAFGIKAYKNPADHAVLPGSIKIGELADKKELYDMVMKHPTDVQYDYKKSSSAPYPYSELYKLGDNVNITGTKKNIYYENQGTKGKDLYKEVLNKHITAIKEKWDSNKLEKENLSYMYNVISKTKEDTMDSIGYAYYDVNKDGIDELFIGEITDGDWKGIVYDIYTMVNRKPQHVVSGGSRDRYFVCDDAFICNEYSSGAMESGTRVYALTENSTELFPQVSFKYDGYKNKKNPWFISYGSEINKDKWEKVSEQTFNERKSTFEKYERFDYSPLSDLNK